MFKAQNVGISLLPLLDLLNKEMHERKLKAFVPQPYNWMKAASLPPQAQAIYKNPFVQTNDIGWLGDSPAKSVVVLYDPATEKSYDMKLELESNHRGGHLWITAGSVSMNSDSDKFQTFTLRRLDQPLAPLVGRTTVWNRDTSFRKEYNEWHPEGNGETFLAHKHLYILANGDPAGDYYPKAAELYVSGEDPFINSMSKGMLAHSFSPGQEAFRHLTDELKRSASPHYFAYRDMDRPKEFRARVDAIQRPHSQGFWSGLLANL